MPGRWRQPIAFAGLVGMVVFLPFAALASAQDDTGEDPLDAIRDAIPEGEPGEWDEQEGVDTFQQLVILVGENTEVDGFGDGSELTGECGGYAYSFDADGNVIDGAMDAGDEQAPVDIAGDNVGQQAFTAANRFQVDTEGIVAYFGFMPAEGEGPMDHDWEITTEGISLDRGGDPNRGGNNRNQGIVDLANDLPAILKTNFNARIEGNMTSSNGLTCMGYGHVEFSGPFLNVISATGMALAGLGVIGLLFNARPAMTWKEG